MESDFLPQQCTWDGLTNRDDDDDAIDDRTLPYIPDPGSSAVSQSDERNITHAYKYYCAAPSKRVTFDVLQVRLLHAFRALLFHHYLLFALFLCVLPYLWAFSGIKLYSNTSV